MNNLTAQNFQPAAVWKRFVAFTIDQLILTIGLFTFGLILGLVLAYGFQLNEMKLLEIQGQLNMLDLAIRVLYFSLMECSPTQATVGKMIMGLKVATIDGERLSFGRALVRLASKVVTVLTLGGGFVMGAFRQDKKVLHDLLTETKVMAKVDGAKTTAFNPSLNQSLNHSFNQSIQPTQPVQGSPIFSSNTIATAPPVMR